MSMCSHVSGYLCECLCVRVGDHIGERGCRAYQEANLRNTTREWSIKSWTRNRWVKAIAERKSGLDSFSPPEKQPPRQSARDCHRKEDWGRKNRVWEAKVGRNTEGNAMRSLGEAGSFLGGLTCSLPFQSVKLVTQFESVVHMLRSILRSLWAWMTVGHLLDEILSIYCPHFTDLNFQREQTNRERWTRGGNSQIP